MRLWVLAVGRLKAGPEKTLAEDYQSRIEKLGRSAGITKFSLADTAESRGQTAESRINEEARFFTRALAPHAFTIVLDEGGKPLASTAFASVLHRHIDGGTADLAFLIGGPDGHAPSTRKNSDLLLSFGPMTWPHRLVRVMLLEQIYRAVTIMVKHPYHRS
jgi:23S rRNA (pseudouridine1915-N3)-methyltransferase